MKIGAVIHGPEVIDTGLCQEFLDHLSSLGEMRAKLGGTMGAVALLDAEMEDRIEINNELVSEALLSLAKESDLLFMLNHAKSRESGLAFGRKVLQKIKDTIDGPVIQLDDGFLISWGEGRKDMVEGLAEALDLDAIYQEMPDENPHCAFRRIEGVVPGDNIWIDGVVIGRATSERVIIREEEGDISYEGVQTKPPGLNKLGDFDLSSALIRSGEVRRTRAEPRRLPSNSGDLVMLVDHVAEDSFFLASEHDDIKCAITVGDDTTKIASSVLYRFGIPIIGLTDGDEDGIHHEELYPPGSAILRLRQGTDDTVGAEVRRKLLEGEDRYRTDDNLISILDCIKSIAGDRLISCNMVNE